MADSSADGALVARLRERDQQALAELYDRHVGALYGLARSILGESADAEEVVEDAFMKLWEDPDSYASARGSVGAFLAVVTRSKALDRLRARRRRAAAVERATEASETGVASPLARYGGNPGAKAEHSELERAVGEAIRRLPDSQRLALELAYFSGYSQSEIAARTNEPLGTIKTRIRAGMEKLREALAPFAAGALP